MNSASRITHHGEPMSETETDYGMIDISKTAVATIANQAINQCYGVVGMADKNLASGIANLLSRDSKKGIDVFIVDDVINIDVYVIVEYGVRIKTVAESIQNTVKFHVEKSIGIPVREVNVFVQGLRIDKEQKSN
ncbi:MAG TPA: Asp23/Gls24 family envelope stress response protein [Anaerolineae bacterium]|nr:Asp23/Gls24 family envelope stress response protein [Anaerolineae bacterium]